MHVLLTSFMLCSVFLQAVKNYAMFAFLLLLIFFPILNKNKQQGGEKEAEKKM